MSEDKRKERRSVNGRIVYIVSNLQGRLPETIADLIQAQFREALQDQREMSVEALVDPGNGIRLGYDAACAAILAAKLEDKR